MSTSAHEYQRCPLDPVPALSRCHARRGSDRARVSTRAGPAPVRTVRLEPTPSTSPSPRSHTVVRSPGSAPDTSSPAAHRAGVPACTARVSIAAARAGFVANSTSSGTPAPTRRAESSIQDFGRYNSRSINAWPAAAAYAKYTPHLRVFDPSRGTGVLPLHADGGGTFLHIAGLVDHQHRIAVTQMCAHIRPQILAHTVGIPLGARQQMLQPVRARVTTALGQRPAILAPQIRDQPQHQRTRVTQGLTPGEPRRDPVHNLIESRLPSINVYAMNRGGRGNFRCLHKLRTMPRSPPQPAQTRRHPIYGCSTNGASPQPDEACPWQLPLIGHLIYENDKFDPL